MIRACRLSLLSPSPGGSAAPGPLGPFTPPPAPHRPKTCAQWATGHPLLPSFLNVVRLGTRKNIASGLSLLCTATVAIIYRTHVHISSSARVSLAQVVIVAPGLQVYFTLLRLGSRPLNSRATWSACMTKIRTSDHCRRRHRISERSDKTVKVRVGRGSRQVRVASKTQSRPMQHTSKSGIDCPNDERDPGSGLAIQGRPCVTKTMFYCDPRDTDVDRCQRLHTV